MIRVLHYVGVMDRGGMEVFIMNLYRRIDRSKIQFDFAVHGDRAGGFEEEITQLGGKFYYFPHMRKNPIKYRKVWKNFWKENGDRYTAFHMHTNSLANVIAMEEAAKAKIPIRIIHSHSSMANKGGLQFLNDFLHKRHQKKLPKLATHLFACSDKAAEWLFGGTDIGGLRVIQINNGVDTEKFKFNADVRREIRQSLGLENKKVIGHIGTFIPVKNHSFLIDVVEQAYLIDPDVRCLLVGGGALLDDIKTAVKEKNLEEAVIFMGVCANVNELLSAMDIFVMPSFYEGLPVSLVEVQTNGLPAVVSDTITKEVKLQNNIYYMPLSESAESWSKKILKVIDNNERTNDYRCIAQNGFDICDTAKMYEKILANGE